MSDSQQLLERIKARVGVKDPETLALVARVAVDTAMLQARALSGQDVAAEQAVVRATAANLDEHVRGVIGSEFLAWTQGFLLKALAVAVVA